jgi:MFS family permease
MTKRLATRDLSRASCWNADRHLLAALQRELQLTAAFVATPMLFANLIGFAGMGFWGAMADRVGRRWSMIIPATIGCFLAPAYLLSSDVSWIIIALSSRVCLAAPSTNFRAT